MNAIKRKTDIYNIILKNGSAEVNELAQLFNCTTQTIRRDLQDLSSQNLIKVGYGSATLNTNSTAELHFSYKETQQLQFKERICQKASELVNDGDVIAIDTGTTTSPLIKYIINKKITIITNNIPLLSGASYQSKARIIVVGGLYDAVSAGTMGSLAADAFNSYNVDIAFLTTMGISKTGELSVVAPDDATVKKAIYNSATKRILLADENKFGLSFLCKYQLLTDFKLIISNSDEKPDFLKDLEIEYL